MYAKVKENAVPKSVRKLGSLFEKTSEWAALCKDMAHGIEAGEVLQISLTDEEKAKIGMKDRRAYLRLIQKHIKEKNYKYKAKSFRSGNRDYLVVRRSPVTKR